jgi:hypothetical protein
MRRSATIIFFLLCLVAAARRAAASCPADQQEQCLAGSCICLSKALSAASARAGGLLLEQWLVASRNQSAAGALPIPPAIRDKLKDSFDAKLLDIARYKIDDNGELNLANLNLHYGDLAGNRVAAVTLIDVIVFRDEKTAADDSTWAHELFHVKQFREWGVHDFAMRYARDFHEVENPAYEFQAAYRRGSRAQ